MKRFVSILAVAAMLLSLTACIDVEDTETTLAQPTISSTVAVPQESTEPPVDVSDYTVAGMMNVLEAYWVVKNERGVYGRRADLTKEVPTAVMVELLCPVCRYDREVVVLEVEEFESMVGQAAFTITEEVSCGNWGNHSESFTDIYNYSIIFTLNG